MRFENRMSYKIYKNLLILLVNIIVLSYCFNIYANDRYTKDIELSKLAIHDDHIEKYFPEGIFIEYNPLITKVLNQNVEENYFKSTGEIIQQRLIQTRLNAEQDTTYTIDFHPGFSLDPQFIIYRNEKEDLKRIGEIFGLTITFPGDGYFYISGHTNNCFNTRKKFKICNDIIEEIKQPYYYVGIESVANDEFELYQEIELKTVLEHVTKGTNIWVLLNKEDKYLIKTEQNILGWTKIPGDRQDKVIKGILFFGD